MLNVAVERFFAEGMRPQAQRGGAVGRACKAGSNPGNNTRRPPVVDLALNRVRPVVAQQHNGVHTVAH